MIAITAPKFVFVNNQRILDLSVYLQTTSFYHTKYVMSLWKALPTDLSEPQRELKRRIIGLILTSLVDTTVHPKRENAKDWFGTANEAVNALMVLSNRFDKSVEQVLQSIGKALLSTESSDDVAEEGTEQSVQGVNELSLARFVFLLGHCALKLLQYSETLAGRAKKARQQYEEKEQNHHKGSGEQMGYVTTSEDIEENILESISDTELVVK